MYLYVLGRWDLHLEHSTSRYFLLWKFAERMANFSAVQRAMAREGIALLEPKTGLG